MNQNVTRMIQHSKIFIQRRGPTILTCLGVLGVVSTTILAIKSTPKAVKLLDDAKEEKGDDLTVVEVIRQAGPVYIPTVSVGAATIACIIGANTINQKRQASLASALYFTNNALKEYRDKVVECFGENADIQVRDAIAKDKYKESGVTASDDNLVFFDEWSGRFFESTEEDVLLAEYHFNRNFVLRGYATLNELYEFLNLPVTELGETLGWSLYAGEAFYGYSWVDFEHRKITQDDGTEYYAIMMPFSPTADYLEF